MSLQTYPDIEQGCKVAGCDRIRRTKGWCISHYNQWHRTGIEPTVPFTDSGRFYKFVAQAAPDECWEWQSTIKKNGYGSFWFNGKADRAHRVSYILSNGPIPDGLLVRHACDNKRCVNPSHLLLGDVLDNARDAVERDRVAFGSGNGNAKLTERQVVEIRQRVANGETQAEMARVFNVSSSAIQFIIAGRNWIRAVAA
jgi:hypothetical protein